MSSLFSLVFYKFLLSSFCFLNAFQLNFFMSLEPDDSDFVNKSMTWKVGSISCHRMPPKLAREPFLW